MSKIERLDIKNKNLSYENGKKAALMISKKELKNLTGNETKNDDQHKRRQHLSKIGILEIKTTLNDSFFKESEGEGSTVNAFLYFVFQLDSLNIKNEKKNKIKENRTKLKISYSKLKKKIIYIKEWKKSNAIQFLSILKILSKCNLESLNDFFRNICQRYLKKIKKQDENEEVKSLLKNEVFKASFKINKCFNDLLFNFILTYFNLKHTKKILKMYSQNYLSLILNSSLKMQTTSSANFLEKFEVFIKKMYWEPESQRKRCPIREPFYPLITQYENTNDVIFKDFKKLDNINQERRMELEKVRSGVSQFDQIFKKFRDEDSKDLLQILIEKTLYFLREVLKDEVSETQLHFCISLMYYLFDSKFIKLKNKEKYTIEILNQMNSKLLKIKNRNLTEALILDKLLLTIDKDQKDLTLFKKFYLKVYANQEKKSNVDFLIQFVNWCCHKTETKERFIKKSFETISSKEGLFLFFLNCIEKDSLKKFESVLKKKIKKFLETKETNCLEQLTQLWVLYPLQKFWELDIHSEAQFPFPLFEEFYQNSFLEIRSKKMKMLSKVGSFKPKIVEKKMHLRTRLVCWALERSMSSLQTLARKKRDTGLSIGCSRSGQFMAFDDDEFERKYTEYSSFIEKVSEAMFDFRSTGTKGRAEQEEFVFGVLIQNSQNLWASITQLFYFHLEQRINSAISKEGVPEAVVLSFALFPHSQSKCFK